MDGCAGDQLQRQQLLQCVGRRVQALGQFLQFGHGAPSVHQQQDRTQAAGQLAASALDLCAPLLGLRRHLMKLHIPSPAVSHPDPYRSHDPYQCVWQSAARPRPIRRSVSLVTP